MLSGLERRHIVAMGYKVSVIKKTRRLLISSDTDTSTLAPARNGMIPKEPKENLIRMVPNMARHAEMMGERVRSFDDGRGGYLARVPHRMTKCPKCKKLWLGQAMHAYCAECVKFINRIRGKYEYAAI